MLVHHFLDNSAARLPHKVALVCGDQRLTYQEVSEKTDQVARALMDLEVARGDRVVIFLDNAPEPVLSVFGVLKAGATFAMVNSTMKAKKLGYILRDSGACTLIAHASKAPIIRESIADAPDLRNVIWVGKSASLGAKRVVHKVSYNWEDLFSSSRPLSFERNALTSGHLPRCIDIDLAAIIYTSGSTGEPKGVMSAHYNVVGAVRSITQYLENREDDIILTALPLSFDYGLYQVLMAFSFGGTVVLEKSFAYPYKVMERLTEEKVSGFPMVPTMAAILLQMNDLGRFDLSALRYITNTAAVLPVPYIQRLRALFPKVKIYSMYGLTECKRVSYLPPDEIDRRPDSVGIPIPNEEVFVVDENGDEVGPNIVGELVVRGSNVMQGYWNAPDETAKRFRPGRYRGETLLYSGDLFRRDAEGFLYFVARRDDMIKTRGERVSPKEIENALSELEGVIEAAVLGVPDEILGQAIKAFVVIEQGKAVSEMDVVKHCTKNLEPFMVPKYLEFRGSLPKTPNGKVDKKALMEGGG